MERTIAFDGARSAATDAEGAPVCPGTYHAIGNGWSGTCRCLDAVGDAPVWGSGTYTADSHLCLAARHAGVIGASGGVIRVTSVPRQRSYAGSTRNGVRTSSWGQYDASFRVAAP